MFLLSKAKPLNLFITIILRQYFTSRTCFWLPDEETNHILKHFYPLNRDVYIVNFSKPLLGHVKDKEIRVITADSHNLLQIESYYCNNYVIQSDFPRKAFEIIEDTLQKAVETKYYNRKYLFYPAHNGFKDNLLESIWVKRVFNIILVNVTEKQRGNDRINVLKIIRPELKLNSKSGMYEKIVFSYEFDNWRTYNLKMSTFHTLPELFRKKLEKGLVFNYAAFSYGFYVNLKKKQGVELRIILSYCSRYKFICNLTESEVKWGEIYGNSSDSGPLKWTVDGIVDVAIGGFYLQGRKFDYLDFVGPTGRLDITCLVPKPRVAINFATLLKSFTLGVWLGIFLLIFIFSMITKSAICNRNVGMSDSIFLILSITLQQSHQPMYTQESPQSLRYLLLIYICFTLVMTAAYTSQLYSALYSDEYENVIETVKDLEDSGYSWGAIHATYIESLRNTNNYTYVELLSRFEEITDEYALIERFYQGNYALLIEKMNRVFILNPKMLPTDLAHFTSLKESLFWVYTSFVMPKHSPFHESLSMHVMNVFETGHLHQWELEQINEKNYKAQLVLQFQPDNDYRPLTFAHTQGIFILWLIGIFSGLLLFIGEIITFTKKLQKFPLIY